MRRKMENRFKRLLRFLIVTVMLIIVLINFKHRYALKISSKPARVISVPDQFRLYPRKVPATSSSVLWIKDSFSTKPIPNRVIFLLPTLPCVYDKLYPRVSQIIDFLINHTKSRVSLAYFEESALCLESDIQSRFAVELILGPLGNIGLEEMTNSFDLVVFTVAAESAYLDMIARSVTQFQRLIAQTQIIAISDDRISSYHQISASLSQFSTKDIENLILSLRPNSMTAKNEVIKRPSNIPLIRIKPLWRRLITQELDLYNMADVIVTLSTYSQNFLKKFVPGTQVHQLRFSAPLSKDLHSASTSKRIIFVGSDELDSVSIKWFITSVMPLLQALSVTLHVVTPFNVGECGKSKHVVCENSIKQQKLNALYRDASLVVYPQLQASLGISITYDALHRGIPVIASGKDLILQYIANDRNLVHDAKEFGFVTCPHLDKECFRRNIENLIRSNKLWRAASEAAVKSIQVKFPREGFSTDFWRILSGLQKKCLRILIDGDALSGFSLSTQNLGMVKAIHNHQDLSVYVVGKIEKQHEKDNMIRSFLHRDQIPTGLDFHVIMRLKWPPDFTPPPRRLCGARCRLTIIMAWEFGHMPIAWVTPINNVFDEVWAFSEWNAQGLRDSGINPHLVHVVPCGIHCHDIKRPPKPPPNNDFIFLFNGGYLPRKGLETVVQAFNLAYPPGKHTNKLKPSVHLVVHTTYEFGFKESETQELQKLMSQNPKIKWYRNEMLTENEYTHMLLSSDVLVMPSRSEGFGIPMIEAMSNGIPVITISQGSGAEDFMREEFSYLVPAVETACVHYPCTPNSEMCMNCYTGDGKCHCWKTEKQPRWFELQVNDLKNMMLKVSGDLREAVRKGELAKNFVKQNYCWESVAPIYVHRFRQLALRSIQSTEHRVSWAPDISNAMAILAVNKMMNEDFHLVSNNGLWWAYIDTDLNVKIDSVLTQKTRWTTGIKNGRCDPSCGVKLDEKCHLLILSGPNRRVISWSSHKQQVPQGRRGLDCLLELTDSGYLMIFLRMGLNQALLWSSG